MNRDEKKPKPGKRRVYERRLWRAMKDLCFRPRMG